MGMVNNKCKIKNKYLENALICLALLGISGAIVLQSPMNPFWKTATGIDSSVFKYVAMVMAKGKMPYKDTFDHKGPLLYIINYWGQMISYYRGVWILELISMSVFLTAAYKTCRLFCRKGISLFLTAAICAPFSAYFQGGNLSEEYALPFLGIALYIYLDFLVNDRVSTMRLVLCGASMAGVCLIRVNMIALWIVFSMAVLIKDGVKKKKQALSFIGWFLLGMILVTAPILIWLIAKGAFSDFVRDYILFNMAYVGDEERAGGIHKLEAFWQFLKYGLTILILPILAYLAVETREWFLHSTYLVFMILNLYLMTMSGMKYGHYGMVMIPVMIYPYARFFGELSNKKRSVWWQGMFMLILLVLIGRPWGQIVRTDVEKLSNARRNVENTMDHYEVEGTDVLKLMREQLEEEDSMIVLGNENFWYLLCQREAASRYSYQRPIAYISNDILQEFQQDMTTEKPKLVIDTQRDKRLFPNKKDYELIFQSSDLDIYRRAE